MNFLINYLTTAAPSIEVTQCLTRCEGSHECLVRIRREVTICCPWEGTGLISLLEKVNKIAKKNSVNAIRNC
jgi:hypothetical protein